MHARVLGGWACQEQSPSEWSERNQGNVRKDVIMLGIVDLEGQEQLPSESVSEVVIENV